MAAQLTVTKGCDDRADPLWMARATSSFPVPVSPVMRTVESVGATLATRESTACRAGDEPTISSNIDIDFFPQLLISPGADLRCLELVDSFSPMQLFPLLIGYVHDRLLCGRV